jgi:hypothetical protein
MHRRIIAGQGLTTCQWPGLWSARPGRWQLAARGTRAVTVAALRSPQRSRWAPRARSWSICARLFAPARTQPAAERELIAELVPPRADCSQSCRDGQRRDAGHGRAAPRCPAGVPELREPRSARTPRCHASRRPDRRFTRSWQQADTGSSRVAPRAALGVVTRRAWPVVSTSSGWGWRRSLSASSPAIAVNSPRRAPHCAACAGDGCCRQ